MRARHKEGRREQRGVGGGEGWGRDKTSTEDGNGGNMVQESEKRMDRR